MTNTIETLRSLIEQRYVKAGNPHPKQAAAYGVEAFLNMVKSQPRFFEQLLAEEIEDASKIA